jgi:CubicO group peptidase (beta-lactamase class C family)
MTLARYMAAHHLAGIIVLERGRIRLERYALGFSATQRWTSFSLAKSFTSTLLGSALHDGSIHSLDDPLVRYIPAFKNSAYATVTVRQLASMTSGIRWNEDYTDPHSDVAQMYNHPGAAGIPRLIAYMATLPRAYPPGTHWAYNTGEADLLGILLQKATGRSLAAYLAEKIWKPYGMAADAYWLKDATDGLDTGGSGLSARLRDYARMGQFLLDGGIIHKQAVLAPHWLLEATAKHHDTDTPGIGYGYQWWTYAHGSYAAIGIFGQLLYIDPRRHLVIVQLGAWPVATSQAEIAARQAFVAAVIRAIDQGKRISTFSRCR